ncbi:MAG: fibronectin type III domain-containing protein [candidate division Zixibacteria bacterium]|nr:fibronectin type III domain-containing protein [candidate division Zixibacteria bacterium]
MNIKLKISVIVLLMFFISGCDRYIESRDPARALTEFQIIPSNLNVVIGNGKATINWEVSSSSTVSSFIINVYDLEYENDDTTGVEPIISYSTSSQSYLLTELNINQTYRITVSAVSNNGIVGEQSRFINTRISLVGMRINGDSEYTNSQDVTVQFTSPPGTSHYILSEDNQFTDAEYLTFTVNPRFTLSDTDGEKTVYGRLQFSDGNLSEIISSSIIFDTESEIDSIIYTNQDTIVTADTVILKLFTSETDGSASVVFTGSGTIDLFDNGEDFDNIADDGIYSGFFEVPTDFSLIQGEVIGTFVDVAGNSVSKISEKTIDVYSIPKPVNLSALGISTYEISLSWTQSTNSDYYAYQIYRDINSPVTESSELIATITSSGTTTFTDSDLDYNSTYNYLLYTITNAGFKNASNEVSAITFDNTAPGKVQLSIQFVVDSTVDLSWTVSGESDFDHYEIKRAADTTVAGALDAPESISIINNINTTNMNSVPLTGINYYQIFVVDMHGVEIGSDIVSVTR